MLLAAAAAAAAAVVQDVARFPTANQRCRGSICQREYRREKKTDC
jgi:hypothetical protein